MSQLYKNCCRGSDRVAMKNLHAQGWPIDRISRHLRIQPGIIQDVVNGEWDKLEKQNIKAAMERDRAANLGKADQETNKIAQIAAAAAAAINNQQGVVDPAALRKQIEAEVRAELEAEAKAATESEAEPELTRGQKAAATRAANKAKDEAA